MASRRSFGWIRKLPSGKHQASYTGPDTMRHKAESTFLSKGDAEQWLRAEEVLIDRGEWTPPSTRPTYRKIDPLTLDEWLEAVIMRRTKRSRKPLRPGTATLYRKLVRLAIRPRLGDVQLHYVTPELIQSWYDSLPADNPTQNANAYQLLNSALAEAVEDGHIARNPARIKGAGKPEPKHVATALTVDELATYLAAIPERYRAALAIAAWGSLRSGEVRALRRIDISDDGTTVSVTRGLSKARDGDDGEMYWVIGPPKTKAGERTIALPPIAAELVAEFLRTWDAEHTTAKDRKALLFTSRHGGPLNDSSLWDQHNKGKKAIGKESLSVHDLRKTGATLAGASGGTIKEIMRRLGHTKPDVAMLYQVADATRDAALAKRMGG